MSHLVTVDTASGIRKMLQDEHSKNSPIEPIFLDGNLVGLTIGSLHLDSSCLSKRIFVRKEFP